MSSIYRSLVGFAYDWVFGRDFSERVWAWLIVVVVVVFAVFNSPPQYSLDPLYTDHRHHAYAAWAFLNIGPEIFTTPIRQWSFGAPRPFINWPSLPYIYPIGSLLIFLPFGIINNLELLPESVVTASMVLVFGVGGVGATWLLNRTLREFYHPALLGAVLVLAAPLYIYWGLNGFFDTVVAMIALYGVRAYWQEDNGTALVALVGALSMHYRLWYLGPVAVAVAIRYIRTQKTLISWQVGVAGILGGGSIVSFILSLPGLMKVSKTVLFNSNPLALTAGITPVKFGVVVGGVVLLAVVYTYESDVAALAALTLAVASVFLLGQWSPWYPILLTPALALTRKRPSQAALVTGFYGVTLVLGWLSANHALLRFL